MSIANNHVEEEFRQREREMNATHSPLPSAEDSKTNSSRIRKINNQDSKMRLSLILGAAMGLGFVLGVLFTPKRNAVWLNYPFSEIAEVSQLLEKYYFDSVSAQKLTQKAIMGMLENLDPHSSYITKEETEQTNVVLTGEFEGIGIQFNILNDTLWVVSVHAGGPSDKAGILPGDKMIAVDTTPIAGIKIQSSEIIKMLRGEKGSKVKVKILRQNSLLTFHIIRDKIPVNSIDAAYLINPQIGYISISNFSFTTGNEFREALRDLVKNHQINKLILDLRGNPGGYLEAAIDVCNELLPAGELIVYTYGQSVGRNEYFASGKGLFKSNNQQIAVLVDEYSASASEIVAGAVQDHDRGIIIGRRSFGKGLVQRQFTLSDGSEVMITVARYYTPTGRCIQRPFENGKSGQYYEDIYQRYLCGEMQNRDSIVFPDSLCFRTPKGKIVYGGGGIMPDVFIPVRQSDSIVLFNLLIAQGIIFTYAMEYADANRMLVKSQYPNGEVFIEKFRIDRGMIDEILRSATKAGIQGYHLSAESAAALRRYLKAYIGRHIYGEPLYYRLLNKDDETIREAVRQLTDL
jgi:carboxyl-terminal processing protease